MSVVYLKRSDKWKVVLFRNKRYVTIGFYDDYDTAKEREEMYREKEKSTFKKYSSEWYEEQRIKQKRLLSSDKYKPGKKRYVY